MAVVKFGTLLHYLRNLAGAPAGEELSDAALLERFAVAGDGAAFESLLRRFGPMVLAVCRRVLGHEQAAEDAFQATFLVLVRRARSIRKRELLGNWLYGVASRTALKARSRAARAQVRERQVREMAPADPVQEAMRRDLGTVLDQELSRLPDKYRQPLVLCYLQGRTNEEAARQLGCPSGTLFTRLARARDMLRGRLTRRGLALSAPALGMALANQAAAAVPEVLVSSTLRAATAFAVGSTTAGGAVSVAAASLAEGVLRSMFVTKLKTIAAACLAVLLVGGGGAGLAYHALGAGPKDKDPNPPPASSAKDSKSANPPSVGGKLPSPPAPGVGQGGGFGAIGGGQGGGFGALGAGGAGFGALGGAGAAGGFGCTGTGGISMGAGGPGGAAVVGPGAVAAFPGGVMAAGMLPPGGDTCRMALLSREAVQRDLGMSREQLKKLSEAQAHQKKEITRLLNQPPTGVAQVNDLVKKLDGLHQEAEKAVEDLLTEAQRKRLKEIVLQQRGPQALGDPEVAEALHLTDDQKDKVKTIGADANREVQQMVSKAMGAFQQPGGALRAMQQLSKKAEEIQKEAGKRLLEVLTDEQKSKWRELTGKPFQARTR
jgi:RNA polymerase sigma factor (sigma-70 family)